LEKGSEKGQREWVGNKKATFVTLGATAHGSYEREVGDFYATSPRAVDALDYAGKLPRSNRVWECAAGQGDLSKALIGRGYDVVSTDLYDRGFGQPGVDFLASDRLLAPCIFTNPPYGIATEFCSHALGLGADEIYMFVKLQFLEGKRRFDEIYSRSPPAEVLQFVERMTVARNGNREMYDKPSAMAFCWMIWRKGHSGAPRLGWISAERGGERDNRQIVMDIGN